MNSSRLLSILMMLQARSSMTSVALAQTLEVSERTILRDIDRLSAAGVPVWGERGRNGGFRLREGWSTQLTGLTAEETQALFLAGLPGPAAELGLGAAALSSRTKVIAGLPAEWRDQASRVVDRLLIDVNDWYRQQESPDFLRPVVDAVWKAHRATMRYRGWERKRTREVHPLGIVLKGGAWYLIAQSVDSSRVATYRIANISSFDVTGKSFKRPKNFDLSQYWRESLARFEADLARLEARIAVTPRGEIWMQNLRMKAAFVSAAKPVRGWREYRLSIESIEHGARQVLSFGAEARVLGPPELRQRVIDDASRVLASYRRE